jgi:radical SAM superfamily enzyme YgiQ (UPF0313 family)
MRKRGKVLFIVHDVYQDDNTFPLNIAYLSAVLKKAGAEVSVYCQDIFHYSNDELADFLSKNEFDLIGVSFMAARFKETVVDLCAVINEYKKNAYLVLGGHGPSPIAEYVLNKTKADVIAIGESEETIVELLDCKLAGGDLAKVKGIAFLSDDIYVVNERRNPVKNLDDIPFPAWDLFPMDRYATCLKFYRHEPGDRYSALLAGRGCVGRCNFCYRIEKAIRLRSVDNIVAEMKALYERYQINYFYLLDEMFIVSKKQVKYFRDAIKNLKLKIKFSCSARVELIDRELLDLLNDCGCTFLNFGMESSSQKVLDLMGKRTTIAQNIKAAELTKESGIGMGLNFLWGNKGDTVQSLKDNVEFIKKYTNYSQLRTIRPVTPYPGCPLYYEAIERQLLSGPEDFFEKFKNSDLLLVNFMDISEDEAYQALFEANKDLITDYYQQTTGNREGSKSLIDQFYNLYFKGEDKFRGARHYKRAEVSR